MRGSVESGRSRLGFAGAAVKAFGFLVEKLGFHVARQEPTFVRFESAGVFVNIYHGRSSYEIGVEVGPRGGPEGKEERFMLGDILEANRLRQEVAFRRAETPEEVGRYLPELAQLAERYGIPAFRGDSAFYLQLRDVQTRLSHEFLLAGYLKFARATAAEAASRGEFDKVVAALQPLSEHLEADDQRMLEHALRQTHRPGTQS